MREFATKQDLNKTGNSKDPGLPINKTFDQKQKMVSVF